MRRSQLLARERVEPVAPVEAPVNVNAPLQRLAKLYLEQVKTKPQRRVAKRAGDVAIKTIKELGGHTTKTEYWGLRNLTYRIKKNRKGHYALINIEAPAPVVHELERRLRINEDVMRFKTIRVEAPDEEPSPILARRDREERRRARREGGRDGEDFGGEFEGGEE